MNRFSKVNGAIKLFFRKSIFWIVLFITMSSMVWAADVVDTTKDASTGMPTTSTDAPAVIQTPVFDSAPIAQYAEQMGPIEPISLNFTNIKVRELLQIIAQFTKLNFVINDNVRGEMSIHLYRVPWTQALDVILKSQDLGERRVGNVVYIATVGDLVKQQIAELEAKQRMRDLVGLEDRVVHLNYANADEILKVLDTKNLSLLSARGSTNVDPRTNSIWIRDTPEHVTTIVRLIRQLDHPVKQVSIEARIVSIRRQNERQIGARFGLSRPSHLSGTLRGANEMAGGVSNSITSIGDTTVAQGTPGTLIGTPLERRLNFDGRASGQMFGSTSAPGSIGLAVAQLGSYFIDLELSALEEQNELDVISSPRLITSNQQKAYIQTGEEIPYQSATSSGATDVQFKDAVLKLEVTPQITPDNRVILLLKVTNNRAGPEIALQGGGSAIPIETEEEESRILLNNNQTVVLGGVYKREKANLMRRIPFFGRLPLIGHLFRNTDKRSDDQELLIFITPHIIQTPADISSS